jgi:hypothetical protein
MRNDLMMEVDRLISIAHLHAMNALARPESQRDTHLAFYRGFWEHYAAAYTTDEDQSDSFVAALDRATRDLMLEIEKNAAVVQASGSFSVSDDAAGSQSGKPIAHTLDGLRPIFRQMIGQ